MSQVSIIFDTDYIISHNQYHCHIIVMQVYADFPIFSRSARYTCITTFILQGGSQAGFTAVSTHRDLKAEAVVLEVLAVVLEVLAVGGRVVSQGLVGDEVRVSKSL